MDLMKWKCSFCLFVWFRFWDAIVLWESFCSAIFDLSWLSFSELETNLWKFIECISEIRSWWKSFDFDEGQTLFHHSSKHLKKPSSLFPTQKMPCDSLPQLLHGIKNKNLPQSLKLHFTIMMNFNSFLFNFFGKVYVQKRDILQLNATELFFMIIIVSLKSLRTKSTCNFNLNECRIKNVPFEFNIFGE